MGHRATDAVNVTISTGEDLDEVELNGAMTVQCDDVEGQTSYSITIQFERNGSDEKSMMIRIPTEQAAELLRYLEKES